ncbi:LysR family transcriptional regulator [Hydrogenophaga pseudoflava]|uniref:HTH-type transcriptional regulator GbpR n=1 Tax=Hydrogenophaga pseudoflava TaxID=47421 RepID=A0A4P6X036_HYDPS|nr:LysR family transcriptional regulator [Hydrogenophaga pseudoflava]QBM27071.1 HTH-type transcriptional regulator GbpR [Hydrogenophaga pseudoflava]
MTLRSSVVLNRLLAKVRVRHLQALARLAELGNVNRAAQAMGMTQPAVTLLLADLERLMEAPLFVRHARGVTPTPLARELLPLVRQMLGRLEESAELVASRLDHQQGTVRVATTAAGANGLLAQVLPGFLAAHPQVQVLVNEVDILAVSASIDTGSADLVFCRQPAVVPQGWRFAPCQDDRFVVACGLQHPLARRKRLALADLEHATWLPNAMGSAARDRYEQLLQQQGWTPRTCQIVTRISPLTWTLLDTRPLLALVPFSVLRPWVERGQLKVLPLPLDLPFEPLGVLRPAEGLGPAGERLVAYVLEAAGEWR